MSEAIPPTSKEGTMLPCPFCGDVQATIFEHLKDAHYFYANCIGCDAEGPPALSFKEARDAWNRRDRSSDETLPAPALNDYMGALRRRFNNPEKQWNRAYTEALFNEIERLKRELETSHSIARGAAEHHQDACVTCDRLLTALKSIRDFRCSAFRTYRQDTEDMRAIASRALALPSEPNSASETPKSDYAVETNCDGATPVRASTAEVVLPLSAEPTASPVHPDDETCTTCEGTGWDNVRQQPCDCTESPSKASSAPHVHDWEPCDRAPAYTCECGAVHWGPLPSPLKATAPPVAEFVSYDNAGGVHIDLNAYLRSPSGQAQLKTLQSSEKGDGTP